MVAVVRNGVSGGNVSDTPVCCFVHVLPKERLSACMCLGDAECGELSLLSNQNVFCNHWESVCLCYFMRGVHLYVWDTPTVHFFGV
jgi:hypothetical protein